LFSASGDFIGFEPFVTGFLQPQPKTAPPLPGAQPLPPDGYIGRPTGLAIAKDGALLIGDDSNNVIYRVTYGDSVPTPTPQKLASEILDAQSSTPMRIGSSAFAAGGTIPAKYSDYDKGVSIPLSWGAAPNGTQEVVLMMEDPDATSPLPFVHWLLAASPLESSLPEGVAKIERPRRTLRQGSNSRSESGYVGPRPPAGDPPHHYHFQIFALDRKIDLPSGFNRHALIAAMQGHVLAKGEVVGLFGKQP
jgi:Raf kinase inhibitor-like YbhB/YbcL family protein